MPTIRKNLAVDDKACHPVDVHVGNRVRDRRRLLGLSQTQLAEKAGVKFQQIQKYEKGMNRVSASRLFKIAHALRAPIEYFFERFDEVADDAERAKTSQADIAFKAMALSGGAELLETFPRISHSDLRRRVLDLVQTLASQPKPTNIIQP